MKPILSIQYLRAFAAIGVLLYHEAENFTGWFKIGSAGVDLFFIISGFIMFVVTETKERDPKLFFWRRLTRIVPLYWCTTLLVVILCLIHPGLMWHARTDFTHVIKSLLFIPQDHFPTVLTGWTLNIEMFFYILVAIMLFFPRRLQLQLISVVLASLVVIGIVLNPQNPFLETYTNNLMLEFLAGLWIGHFWTLRRLPGLNTGISLLGIGVLVLSIEGWINLERAPFLQSLYYGLPMALIVLGALSAEAGGKIPHVPFLKTLGDASYSLYLLHSIVQAIVNRLPISSPFKIAGSIAISIFVSVLVFRCFERPVGALIRKISA